MSHSPGSEVLLESVSVVIAVHNGEAYIERGLGSILAQDITDFECIVVNDGSTDRTHNILSMYARMDCRVRIFSPGRVGFVEALNIGISEASGALIARQDIDDVSYPSRLRKQREFLSANKDVGVVGCAFALIDERRGESYIRTPPLSDPLLRRALAQYIPFAHTTVMFRKKAWHMAGGYTNTTGQDLALWIAIAANGWKMAALPEILGVHYVYDGSYFFRTYNDRSRAFRIIKMHLSAVHRLKLPVLSYANPIGRIAYLFLPNRLKRSVRRRLYHAEIADRV